MSACQSEDLRPTIRTRVPLAVGFEVETLQKAMKGFGTKEAAITEVLVNCSCNQRQVIREQYNSNYGRDLMKDLKKELSGNLEDVVVALITPVHEYLARELRHAIDRKNGEVMVEILCTKAHYELSSIKSSYEQLFTSCLEEDLKKATSGLFEKVMLAIVAGHRSDDFSEDYSHALAHCLFSDEHGVNEEEVVKAFSGVSFRQLRDAFVEYYKLAGRSLGEAFDLSFKGTEKSNMKALLKCFQNRFGFFAEALKKSMAGLGTRDRDLIRLIVSRSEIDLGNIKDEYYKMYDTALEKDVKRDTSGEYKKILIALLTPNY